MSEEEAELNSAVIGTCNICGQTLTTQKDLSTHSTEAHEDEGWAAE